jgi:hypothetical protein
LKLGEMWRRWQMRDCPEHMLTKAEAIEHVRQYAEANGRRSDEPVSIHVERRALDPTNRKAGFRLVYVMALGTYRPVPFVEVDAVDGKVRSAPASSRCVAKLWRLSTMRNSRHYSVCRTMPSDGGGDRDQARIS